MKKFKEIKFKKLKSLPNFNKKEVKNKCPLEDNNKVRNFFLLKMFKKLKNIY